MIPLRAGWRRVCSWLKTNPSTSTSRPPYRACLRVEQLESREIPSATPVNPAIVPLPLTGRVDMGASAQLMWENGLEHAQQQAQAGHANVLFLGDSITALYPQVGTAVWNQSIAPLGADNYGIGGITTSEILWLVNSGLVAAVSPKVVVLEIGTNNLLRGHQDPVSAATGVALIVAELEQELPNTQIIVQGVLPLGASPSDPLRQASTEFNWVLSQWVNALSAGGRIGFVNFGEYYLNADGTPSSRLLSDGIHPTALGYELYNSFLYPLIVASLQRVAEPVPNRPPVVV